MIIPSYPEHPYRIREDGSGPSIFCEMRRRWVRLTPEEWVRQNIFQWLKQVGYPGEMISVEKGVRVVEMQKRYDLLVYDAAYKPWMMVECKAQHVRLSEDTLMQALRYNIALPVPHLMITNGDGAMVFTKTEKGLVAGGSLPAWGAISF
jgi:hypothetical protein